MDCPGNTYGWPSALNIICTAYSTRLFWGRTVGLTLRPAQAQKLVPALTCCSGAHVAGGYNEVAFAGLDAVLDAAAQYGIRVIMTMADYWLGVDSYKSVRSPLQLDMHQDHLVSGPVPHLYASSRLWGCAGIALC